MVCSIFASEENEKWIDTQQQKPHGQLPMVVVFGLSPCLYAHYAGTPISMGEGMAKSQTWGIGQHTAQEEKVMEVMF